MSAAFDSNIRPNSSVLIITIGFHRNKLTSKDQPDTLTLTQTATTTTIMSTCGELEQQPGEEDEQRRLIEAEEELGAPEGEQEEEQEEQSKRELQEEEEDHQDQQKAMELDEAEAEEAKVSFVKWATCFVLVVVVVPFLCPSQVDSNQEPPERSSRSFGLYVCRSPLISLTSHNFSFSNKSPPILLVFVNVVVVVVCDVNGTTTTTSTRSHAEQTRLRVVLVALCIWWARMSTFLFLLAAPSCSFGFLDLRASSLRASILHQPISTLEAIKAAASTRLGRRLGATNSRFVFSLSDSYNEGPILFLSPSAAHTRQSRRPR